MATQIQAIGYLLKKEKLATYDTQVAHAELILEGLAPFPGFYEQYFLPTSAKEETPKSLFLVIKDFDVCHEDEFIRMCSHVQREHKVKFNAALSSIQLLNQPATCIRINMDDYSGLESLIQHFKLVGVKFQTSKAVKAYQSLIKIRRFFNLELLEDGIFKDQDKSDTYYIEVPAYMTWEEFEATTLEIRNNWDYKVYDAAQAAIYNRNGIVELVRIFDLKADIEKLRYLHQKYSKEANRD